MSGIYIHIPFCRSKCAYCSFFSVVTKQHSDEVLSSIVKELTLQRRFLQDEKVETIYFGGGTPSILKAEQLFMILDAVYSNFSVENKSEITIEINPDDATFDYLSVLSKKFNRLSIGIQSFVEEDLSLLGRKHNTKHANQAILNARKAGFTNINIDLIFGISENHNKWIKTIDTALSFNLEHISAYTLTVEEKTILYHKIKQNKQSIISDKYVETQYNTLIKKLSEAGYDHYEISNFSKPGYASKHNSAYWKGKPYLGIGPSAHSFNGQIRQWNVSNIVEHCQAIAQSKIPSTSEILSDTDKYNEFIMLRLRQKSGIELWDLNRRFGKKMENYFLDRINPYITSGHVANEGERFYLSESSFLISDYIISGLLC